MSIIGFADMTFQGRLTDEPELRTLDNGRSMCKFRVAVNRRIPGGKEKTSYIPVTVFGKDAVNCAEYLSTGRVVLVSGEFETDKVPNKDGEMRTYFGVVARRVDFGSGGAKEEDDNKPRGRDRYGDQERSTESGYRRTRARLRDNRGDRGR